MNLEQTVASYGYKPSDFTECQLETIQSALDNNLQVSTIINPKVDELVMNIVVHETLTIPDKISMLPYLYPGVTFSQLGRIRESVESGDVAMLKQYTDVFKREDLSKERKVSLTKLMKRGLNYLDLLDSPLSDEELDKVVVSRIAAPFKAVA